MSIEHKGYRGPLTCKIVGITYRQLDYWARTDLVKPSLQEATGSGTQRVYSFTDLIHLKVIKNLLDAGVNLNQVRTAVEYLQSELKVPLEDAMLVSDGKTVYAVTSENEYVDLLRNGQGVIAIAIKPVLADIRQRVVDTLADMSAQAVHA